MGKYVDLAMKILSARPGENQTALEDVRPVSDPYKALIHEAIDRICDGSLPGTIEWVKDANPSLYESLTDKAIAEIEDICKRNAPVEELRVALDRWLKLYDQAASLFAKAQFSALDLE